MMNSNIYSKKTLLTQNTTDVPMYSVGKKHNYNKTSL